MTFVLGVSHLCFRSLDFRFSRLRSARFFFSLAFLLLYPRAFSYESRIITRIMNQQECCGVSFCTHSTLRFCWSLLSFFLSFFSSLSGYGDRTLSFIGGSQQYSTVPPHLASHIKGCIGLMEFFRFSKPTSFVVGFRGRE